MTETETEFLPQGSIGFFDRVVFIVVAVAEAIENKKYKRSVLLSHGWALMSKNVGQF